MSHRSYAGFSRKGTALALMASAFVALGSPLVAVSSAADAGGAQRSVSANFGDCKNNNSGLHLGYVCPSTDDGGTPIVIS
jgi:hypothetical protein